MTKTSPVPGGVVSQITASYDRKLSDGAYGSVGVFMSATVDLAADANPDEAMSALFEWVKAAAVRNAKPSFDAVTHNTQAPTAPVAPAVASEPEAAPEAGVFSEDGKQKWCPIHKVWMKARTKEGNIWYSHKDGESWCRGE